MKFRNVYDMNGQPDKLALAVLYQLLAERPPEANISHSGTLPTMEQHREFVRSRPYREWYIVFEEGIDVGAIYATHLNEVGIAILKAHHERGYATKAVKLLMETLDPLPAVPGRRRGTWIANVAPKNWRSKLLFEEALGCRIIQLTYEIPRGGKRGEEANRS